MARARLLDVQLRCLFCGRGSELQLANLDQLPTGPTRCSFTGCGGTLFVADASSRWGATRPRLTGTSIAPAAVGRQLNKGSLCMSDRARQFVLWRVLPRLMLALGVIDLVLAAVLLEVLSSQF